MSRKDERYSPQLSLSVMLAHRKHQPRHCVAMRRQNVLQTGSEDPAAIQRLPARAETMPAVRLSAGIGQHGIRISKLPALTFACHHARLTLDSGA